jgi:ABC-type transport system involved in cytochrome bd biosynthesis fused ATPase/permease subunit
VQFEGLGPRSSGRTTLIVTHRLSTVVDADQILRGAAEQRRGSPQRGRKITNRDGPVPGSERA